MTGVAPRRTGVLAFTAGNAVAQGAALLRYAVLARLLGPEQLGLAAILILTSQFFEQITDAGLDRFLVQSRLGNTRSANGAAHGALIGRGLLVGLAIALMSGLLSRFFQHPELRPGMLILAIAPALAGFSHFDFRRVQRHHHFGLEGRITTWSELASLVTIIVAAVLTRSFVAVAFALVARSAVAVLLSHLLARRPYRVGPPGGHGAAMLAFGLPLMLNGVLLFLTGQGDRLFIAGRLGAAELGHYSAVLLLIFYPATMLSRLIHSINMPVVAAARDDGAGRGVIIDRIAGQAVVLAMAMAAGFALLAPAAVPLIFGPRFSLPAPLIALVGVLQAARFVRLWPVTVALATGHSRYVLWNSVARLLAFPLAFALGAVLGGLWGVVVAFTLAEFIAFSVSMVLLDRRGLGDGRRDGVRLGLLALFFAAVAALSWAAAGGPTAALAGGAALAVLVAAATARIERPAIASLISLARGMVRRRARG